MKAYKLFYKFALAFVTLMYLTVSSIAYYLAIENEVYILLIVTMLIDAVFAVIGFMVYRYNSGLVIGAQTEQEYIELITFGKNVRLNRADIKVIGGKNNTYLLDCGSKKLRAYKSNKSVNRLLDELREE